MSTIASQYKTQLNKCGLIPQREVHVSGSIRKYEHGQISSNKTKIIKIKNSFELMGDMNVKWGVFVGDYSL